MRWNRNEEEELHSQIVIGNCSASSCEFKRLTIGIELDKRERELNAEIESLRFLLWDDVMFKLYKQKFQVPEACLYIPHSILC